MVKVLAMLALLAIGCATESTPAVWAHSSDLELQAQSAAVRIELATGIHIDVNQPGTSEDAVPMFWSEPTEGRGDWAGQCGPNDDWIAIDLERQSNPGALPTTVLHEMLHMLGVDGHIAQGTGVMSSAEGGGDLLTEADLTAVCSVAECTRFVPEVM